MRFSSTSQVSSTAQSLSPRAVSTLSAEDDLLTRYHPPRGVVMQRIDAADTITVRECLEEVQTLAIRSHCNHNHDMRVRKRGELAADGLRQGSARRKGDNDDDVCIVQWFDGQVTVELPCWIMRLKAWRQNDTLAFRKVIYEDVLYHSYREKTVLAPLEVIQFLYGTEGEGKIVDLLRYGTIVPLTQTLREEPSWSDAIISDAPGLRDRLPWEVIAASPNTPEDQIRNRRSTLLAPLSTTASAGTMGPLTSGMQGNYAVSRRKNAKSPQTPSLEALLKSSPGSSPSPQRRIKFISSPRLEVQPEDVLSMTGSDVAPLPLATL